MARNRWTLALSVSTLLFAGAAAAHGGFGGGNGACGSGGAAGCGAGCATTGCGPAGGPGHGAHGFHGMQGLMTPDEMAAHRAKMSSLASVDECRSYLADFGKQLEARAKEKGTTAAGPAPWMCDRMQAHGRFNN